MKKRLLILAIVLIVGLGVYAGIFYYDNLRGVWPAVSRPSQDIVNLIPGSEPLLTNGGNVNQTPPPPAVNETDFPLTLPDGFTISIFASDVPNARVLALDPEGNVWVSRTKDGIVEKLSVENGIVTNQEVMFRNLNNPHGLAFEPGTRNLFIAERTKVSKIEPPYTGSLQKVFDLTDNSGHTNRVFVFGSDGRIYGNIGSSCNVCEESDSRLATVYSVNADGSDFKILSTGNRNAAFLAFHPETQELWTTENGRDRIGDDIPPDEINIIREGNFYGWPFCFGKQIVDTTFAITKEEQELCGSSEPSYIDIQAHSAPLGLAFVPESSDWPVDFKHDLIIAYHGSWNRTVPTGYKLVRMILDEQGNYSETQDFITGWIKGNDALGRPVDVIMTEAGVMYVSDDKAGVIYRITYGN